MNTKFYILYHMTCHLMFNFKKFIILNLVSQVESHIIWYYLSLLFRL